MMINNNGLKNSLFHSYIFVGGLICLLLIYFYYSLKLYKNQIIELLIYLIILYIVEYINWYCNITIFKYCFILIYFYIILMFDNLYIL